MVQPFSKILKDSWAFTQKHIVTLAVGAVIFGSIQGIVQWNMSASMQNSMGFNPQHMQELADRARAGDQAAQQQMMQELFDGKVPKSQDEATAMMKTKMMGSFTKTLPAVIFTMIISMILGVLAATYYMQVALFGLKDIGLAASKTANTCIKFFGLSVWMMLRSFIWIPIIGIIPALYFYPRLALSPIYLLEKNKGITESARLSLKNTEGYWGKIVGNGLLLGLIIGISMIIISGIVNAIGLLPILLVPIISSCVTAFAVVFSVHLGHSVMENPLNK